MKESRGLRPQSTQPPGRELHPVFAFTPVPQRVAATCPLPPGCCRVTMLCGEGGGEETDAQLQLNFR